MKKEGIQIISNYSSDDNYVFQDFSDIFSVNSQLFSF